MSTCLYFAYGSNMLKERLLAADRCVSAVTLGAATAPGYRVDMTKRSRRDGSGKATLVADPAQVAHGVLYEVPLTELALLDESEGVGFGYDRHDALAVSWRAKTVSARTYIAPPPYVDEALRPYDWYAALCVAGARQHGLPDDHVAQLARFATIPDGEPERPSRRRALALLRGAGFADLADRCEG